MFIAFYSFVSATGGSSAGICWLGHRKCWVWSCLAGGTCFAFLVVRCVSACRAVLVSVCLLVCLAAIGGGIYAFG